MSINIWEKVYKDYPVNDNLIWLNNCGTTPSNLVIEKEMSRYFKAYSEAGIFSKEYSYTEIKSNIQSIIGKLINASPDDVAIVHNTAEGMNLVSYGLNFQKGDEFLVLENEYPSNIYPWEHLKEKGVILKTVATGSNPSEFLENFSKGICKNTKGASMTAVHWCTGMPFDLKEIGKICKEKDILLIVDGSQGVGHTPIDMSWGISVMAFSGWKWFLGPLGLGYLVIPKKIVKQLKPVFKGTDSVVDSQKYLPYHDQLLDTVERYMFSTVNFNDWIYAETSLKYLDDLGFENVMAKIKELGDHIKNQLRNIGFKLDCDSFDDFSGGIITGIHEEKNVTNLVRTLRVNNIIAAERLGKLRLAPHIYNSVEQIDKVIKILKEA